MNPFWSTYGGSEMNAEVSAGDDDTVGSWVLNKPLPHTAQERALEYLARIRKLSVDYDQEEPIWTMLSACLCPRKPLFPNLWRLDIISLVYNRGGYLTAFLSPSLKVLRIYPNNNYPLLETRAIVSIRNLAKASGCDLEIFKFHGYAFCCLPEALIEFKNLQKVRFALNSFPEPAGPTIVQFFSSLPSLRLLTCNIGAFPPSTENDLFFHANLQKLAIQSPANRFSELFGRCLFPSVTKVRFWSCRKLPHFEGLKSSCPNTHELGLHLEDFRHQVQPVEFKRVFAPLLSLPIKVFRRGAFPINLASSDLHTAVESWPELRSLRIGLFTGVDPFLFLATLPNHLHLDCLRMQVSFRRLVDDIPTLPDLIKAPNTQGQRPRLRTLQFYCGCTWEDNRPNQTDLQVSKAKKRTVVEYLLLLFPSLEKLKFASVGAGHLSGASLDKLVGFQEIFLELKKKS